MRYQLSFGIFLLVLLANTKQSWADEAFSLVIDPFTGGAQLRNDGREAVELDGYFVTGSSDTLLSIDNWVGLQDRDASSGWAKSFSPSGNRLGELNLLGSLSVPANSGVAIGAPYMPFVPAALGEIEPGLTSLSFIYSLATEERALTGDVEFSSRNTVVLVVDPTTGESALENQSGFDLQLDGYLVKSPVDVLDAEGWIPISVGDPDWVSAATSTNRIAEANLISATRLLPNGGSLQLGRLVDVDRLNDESDLLLEFTTTGLARAITGGVLFRTTNAGLVGDCNGDGVIDAVDLSCVASVSQRDAVLQELLTLPGDLDGNQTVDFADFLILSANFGDTTKTRYTEGDIDLDGGPSFPDFLVLSANFGASPSGIASVPEPVGIGLMAVGVLLAPWRAQQRNHRKQ